MGLKERIEELRDEINKLIEKGATQEEVYKVSQKLDKLIKEYYQKKSKH